MGIVWINFNKDSVIDEYESTIKIRWMNDDYVFTCKVVILDEVDRYKYVIIEPYTQDVLRDVSQIIDKLKFSIGYTDEFVNNPIHTLLKEFNRITDKARGEDKIRIRGLEEIVKYKLLKEYLGYDDLTYLLADDNIEDISCIGPDTPILVWHKKWNDRGWIETNIILNESELDRYISKMAFRTGKTINIVEPILEGLLPEGFRVSATWKREVSPKGSSFTIRKYRPRPYTLIELIDSGVLSIDLSGILWNLLETKRFIFFVGPSGSGKTTLLNALAQFINPNLKVVTIEDIQEIYLPHIKGWKPYITRIGGYVKEYDIFELVKIALRERADYLILGESRGVEARLIFQGASTGHGCLTTFHASTIDELEARLKSKPISIDPGMMDLIDTVIILKYVDGGARRRVYKAFRQIDGRWFEVYDLKSGRVSRDALIDMDHNDVARRTSFLRHLVSLNISSLWELAERLNHFYNGKYIYEDGRWMISNVG